ncbi:MAG: hypothetical protein RMK32_00985 [Anaerolineae bacterium]|nr:hypothetical protein [Thermoflexus sp.]MDW8064190.1 hypothetical protein [Anaerolineae bacterium]
MKTGIALVKDPDGAWWLEIGKRRYQHLQEIYDDQTAMLVLEAFQAIRGMAEGSAERLLPISGTAPSMPALAEQLDHILQELLRRYPELPYRAVRFETLPDGTLGIIAGGQRYRHPEEVPDPQLRALLQEAIQRWEGGKGAG